MFQRYFLRHTFGFEVSAAIALYVDFQLALNSVEHGLLSLERIQSRKRLTKRREIDAE